MTAHQAPYATPTDGAGCPLCDSGPAHHYSLCRRFTEKELLVWISADRGYRFFVPHSWDTATVGHLRRYITSCLGFNHLSSECAIFCRGSPLDFTALPAHILLQSLNCRAGDQIDVLIPPGLISHTVRAKVPQCRRCGAAAELISRLEADLITSTAAGDCETPTAGSRPLSPAAVSTPPPQAMQPQPLPPALRFGCKPRETPRTASPGQALQITVVGTAKQRTVHLSNVPVDYNRCAAFQALYAYGTILRLRLRRQTDPGRSFTFMFVEFDTAEAAKALCGSSFVVDKHTVTCKTANQPITTVDAADAIPVDVWQCVVSGELSLADVQPFDEGTYLCYPCAFASTEIRQRRDVIQSSAGCEDDDGRTTPSRSPHDPPATEKKVLAPDFGVSVQPSCRPVLPLRPPQQLSPLTAILFQQLKDMETAFSLAASSMNRATRFNALRCIACLAGVLYTHDLDASFGHCALSYVTRAYIELNQCIAESRSGKLDIEPLESYLDVILNLDSIKTALLTLSGKDADAIGFAAHVLRCSSDSGTVGSISDVSAASSSTVLTDSQLDVMLTIVLLVDEVDATASVKLLSALKKHISYSERHANVPQVNEFLLMLDAAGPGRYSSAAVPGGSNVSLARSYLAGHTRVAVFSLVMSFVGGS